MFLVSNLYKTLLDALFPLSDAEEELLSYTPERALRELPVAPDFSGLAISPNEAANMKSVLGYRDERVAKLVWNIKYKKSKHATKIGGFALWQELILPTNSLSASMLVIPIPITKKRRKERGYNQCELLTDEIARLDVAKNFQIEKNLLIRVRHADRQTLKDRKNRVEDAKGIFAVDEKVMEKLLTQNSGFKNARVIVVDDVITTGSTLNEAMQTMNKVGFNDVRGLSLAH